MSKQLPTLKGRCYECGCDAPDRFICAKCEAWQVEMIAQDMVCRRAAMRSDERWRDYEQHADPRGNKR